MITSVGQSSDGMVATLSPTYKAEILVKLVDKEYREDDTDVYAAKTKQELQKVLVGAKIKALPVSFIGTADQAPIELVVVGSDRDSVTAYAELALAELKRYLVHQKPNYLQKVVILRYPLK